MGRSGALHSLIQEAYRPRASLSDWLDTLVEQMADLFPSELGAVGRLSDGESTVGDYAVHVTSARVAHAFRQHRTRSAHRIDFLRTHAGRGPLASTRLAIEASPSSDTYLRRMHQSFESVGVFDMRHLTTCDVDGLWLTLGIVQSEPRPVSRQSEYWMRVRRHLTAALHAQHAFDVLRARLDGRPCETHEQLRGHLCELDAGATGLATDDATQLWCSLSRGELRAIDRFERAGRQYLVVASTYDDDPTPTFFTADEVELAALLASGKSEKWIALTQGIARSTMNARMKRALRKLGLHSRVELLKRFRVHDGVAIPALSLRAHALGLGRYLLAFDVARPSTSRWARPPSLTSAQWRVVQLALEGLSDRAIARRVSLSPHTVSHHLRHAYTRLDVGSRDELFAHIERESP